MTSIRELAEQGDEKSIDFMERLRAILDAEVEWGIVAFRDERGTSIYSLDAVAPAEHHVFVKRLGRLVQASYPLSRFDRRSIR